MNRDELKTILPHREPMLLVDEAAVGEDGIARGSYTVRGDEYFLDGHFPGNPIVPGGIQCEMAAQTCCVLFADKVQGSTPLFAGINKVRFRRQVKPGERIDFECTPVREVGPFCFAKVRGSVNGSVCVEGEFSFALMK